ncbi:MAG: metallophosphoesterase [bacterium]
MPRILPFLPFIIGFLFLVGLLQWYIFSRWRSWSLRVFSSAQSVLAQRLFGWFLLAGNFLFILQFYVRTSNWYQHPLVQVFIVTPSSMVFAGTITAGIILILVDLVRWSFNLLAKIRHRSTGLPLDYDPKRRTLLKAGGFGVAAAAIGLPVIASVATARDYQIHRISLFLDGLPAGLEGLTIAQLSDIHSGVFMTENDLRDIFEIANSLHPDLIALTGDYIDASDLEIPSIDKTIGLLRSEFGCFACLGNHDHFATALKVTEALEGRGIIVLNNAHRTITINGDPLTILGVDDYGRGYRNFARLDYATESIERNSFKILLSHRPDFFPQAKQAGISLTLSGHTHGGQVGVGIGSFRLNPVDLVYKYAMGLYIEEGKQLYVNVGVGMVGVPIRLVKPEIALFTLMPARRSG